MLVRFNEVTVHHLMPGSVEEFAAEVGEDSGGAAFAKSLVKPVLDIIGDLREEMSAKVKHRHHSSVERTYSWKIHYMSSCVTTRSCSLIFRLIPIHHVSGPNL